MISIAVATENISIIYLINIDHTAQQPDNNIGNLILKCCSYEKLAKVLLSGNFDKSLSRQTTKDRTFEILKERDKSHPWTFPLVECLPGSSTYLWLEPVSC